MTTLSKKISLFLVCPVYKRLKQEWPNPTLKNIEALATELLHGFNLYKHNMHISFAKNKRAHAALKYQNNKVALNFSVDLQAPLEANYCALVRSIINYAYDQAEAKKDEFIYLTAHSEARGKAHDFFVRGWLSERMTALGFGAPVPELAAVRAQRLARAKQCAAPHP